MYLGRGREGALRALASSSAMDKKLAQYSVYLSVLLETTIFLIIALKMCIFLL